MGWISAVDKPLSKFASRPKRYDRPKDAFTAGQLLDDYLEAAEIQDGNEFIIRHRNQQFFPSYMPAAALPFVGFFNPLHRMRQLENGRSLGNVFEPHELVAAATASVPGLVSDMLKSLRVELHRATKKGAADFFDATIKILGLGENTGKFFVGEFKPGHFQY